jgi:hypothetical protein
MFDTESHRRVMAGITARHAAVRERLVPKKSS